MRVNRGKNRNTRRHTQNRPLADTWRLLVFVVILVLIVVFVTQSEKFSALLTPFCSAVKQSLQCCLLSMKSFPATCLSVALTRPLSHIAVIQTGK